MISTVAFSVLAILFGSLVLAQLLTRKSITLRGFTDKQDDPKKFWTLVMFYTAASLGAINMFAA